MNNDDSKIKAMLADRERLEELRIIANQLGYKFYLQPKYLILILAILIGGIIIWVISPKLSSNRVIPLMGYILISQLIFASAENTRLKEQLNAVREMNKLENK